VTKQYELKNNVLILRVKKAPIFVQVIMFFFTSLFFLLPLAAIIFGFTMGKGMHFGYFILLIVFGALGFYMLRLSLWSSRGREIISFQKGTITYIADYGWFKDGKQEREITDSVEYSIRKIGYTDDNTGGLVIELDKPINCVTKMAVVEIEELIFKLKEMDFSN